MARLSAAELYSHGNVQIKCLVGNVLKHIVHDFLDFLTLLLCVETSVFVSLGSVSFLKALEMGFNMETLLNMKTQCKTCRFKVYFSNGLPKMSDIIAFIVENRCR